MWMDVSGLNAPTQKLNLQSPPAPARVHPTVAFERLQKTTQAQRFVEHSVDFSPAASRLASRQRHLETPTWLSSSLTPSKPARGWTSQFLAQQTWNWMADAFPGCCSSPARQMEALQLALREFSPGTFEHSKRVGELALRFANDLGIDELEQEKLEKGAEFMEVGLLGLQVECWSPEEREKAAAEMRETGKFHDIGKLAIPEHILHKPGPLSPEERSVVEMHPLIGESIMREVPGFEQVLPAVRHHHERWDAAGYVDRIGRTEIPFHAQLISLSDTFDALTEDRPYRKAMTAQQACQEIVRQRGGQFDPDLADAFVYMILSSKKSR